MNRRQFLQQSALAATALAAPQLISAQEKKSKMKLGLVTWNLASTWTLQNILDNCRTAQFEGVEFRTTHPHGVEPTLNATQRAEVKKKCADAGLTIWGLGTTCEFQSPNPDEVKKQIAICADFVKLAADLGAHGVKVRPNGLPKEVPIEKTLAQIGASLVECGKIAADHGVEIWLEVHGGGTQEPKNLKTIMDAADHKSVGACWNSNPTDVKDGSVKWAFDLLGKRIRSCHINDLTSNYPWREFFTLLRESGYDRYTLCEYGKSFPAAEGAEFMKQYRAKWLELTAQ